VRGLTTCWIGKSSKWLPSYTANYGCDCLRQVDLGTGSRGNPKDAVITTRETTSRAFPVWHVAAKSAGTYAARRGGRPVSRGGDHRSGPAAGARRLQSNPSICDAFRAPASAPGLFLAVTLDEVLEHVSLGWNQPSGRSCSRIFKESRAAYIRPDGTAYGSIWSDAALVQIRRMLICRFSCTPTP
jgi:hypothetical protein